MLPHLNAEEYMPPLTRKVYINPNFHGQQMLRTQALSLQGQITQPSQPPTLPQQIPAIHVNPHFLQRQQALYQVQQLQQMQQMQQIQQVPQIYYASPLQEVTAAPPAPPPQAKIISKASTCLVRKVSVPKPNPKPAAKPISAAVKQAPLVSISKRKIVRQVALKPAVANVNSTTKRTKYKLVRAISLTFTPLVKKHRSIRDFVGQFALRRNNETSSKPQVLKPSVNKSVSMVSIHGVMYRKTAKNKLIKLDAPSSSAPSAARTLKRSLSGRTLFVSGNKFVLDSTGCRLTRVQSSAPVASVNSRRRIDFGGLTYIASAKTQNVFIRNTNHLSRAHLMSARQRSLQLLNGSRVKTNVPCAIYQRLGKCAAHNRGKCRKLHDKRQVAICPRFLRGDCSKPSCLLSHNVTLEKMPVCRYYLLGICVREDCPYLHKKLSRKADICIDFLRGYCPLAAECNKRHEFVCPELERKGKCEIANCSICQQKPKKLLKLKPKAKSKVELKPLEVDEDGNATIKSRYFKCNDDPQEIAAAAADEEPPSDEDADNEDAATVSGLVQRPKLGTLPAFIPLGNEE